MIHLPSAWLLVTCAVVSCGGSSSPGPASEIRSPKARNLTPAVEPGDAAQLAADNLAFGLDLSAQLRVQNTGNFLFSQPSISLALAMVYAGAANQTAAQIAAALRFTLPPERLHPAFDALDLALTTPPAGTDANAFRLAIASSLWMQRGFSLLPSYLDLLAESYGAGLFIEDFAGSPEAARADINRWVSERTEQMIPTLFDPGSINPNARLVLADAVYFRGGWQQQFDPTSPNGIFHAPAGDVSVPMMASQEVNAGLWAGTGWNAASLAYTGGTASMVVLVPDAATFDAFERGLDAVSLAVMLAPAQVSSGNVVLPRFKFATSAVLNDVLAGLGMADAFAAARADFSAMDGRRDLAIGTVVHKAIISVDERGTTAAAATGVAMVNVSIMLPSSTLVVDRPFLFFIRHHATGAILFQGRVVDPSK